jgi:hypothetical protein
MIEGRIADVRVLVEDSVARRERREIKRGTTLVPQRILISQPSWTIPSRDALLHKIAPSQVKCTTLLFLS